MPPGMYFEPAASFSETAIEPQSPQKEPPGRVGGVHTRLLSRVIWGAIRDCLFWAGFQSRTFPAASTGELSSIYPHSAGRGHPQPTFEMNHVAQRNQSGTMFSRDRGRRAMYRGVADREQGGKLFTGELFVGELCRF